ncbi:type IV secretory system conjugative DNA transfer family protein [Romboutsia sp. 1001216sp1]|uniref:VirD4-like conjugal transfer protein, CD1115 family n=1 Tax=unclassified Romboutsia TaxID=2626894 RepID=UPI00189DEDD5|nr:MULTISPECIES: type IV secretory system conjugative DNA transfer family protein [unclassified Romboutsia]MDB8803191.1 type IV secretory system conjugative DNA transfer family protein [Romboutsia sp. 1001216sp1]MDB8814550.1 type IV secretory system conjugative DNA transfer family protein [Romboutsia sp. 1001216sp1]
MNIGERIQEFLKSKNKEFEITRKLVDKDFAIKFGAISMTLVILITNLIVEYLTKLPNLFLGGDKPSIFGFLNLTYIVKLFPLYLIIIAIFSALYIKLILDIKKSFNEIADGQKGTARFATREEIASQYRAVPIKDEGFKGKGGVPIARGYHFYKDNYGNTKEEEVMYIDDSSVNNIIIGTTRSGKGETFVVPTIDIYSRAEEKPSMVINDPKGELIAMSKETLETRGYEVLLLNLTDPMNSMSYNPLELIIQAYKNEEFGEAQLLCQTLTYSIFNDPNTKDAFWQNTAMSLTNALILALCEKYIPINKEEKITMYTVANMLTELGTVYTDFNGAERYKIDDYFNELPITSVAKMQYATTQFAKSNTKGSILVSAMNKLSMFTFEKIAKMTSKNSFDLKDIGFINKENDKPKAIFMATPDYDKSIHVMASIFVRQAYYVLAKNATLSRTGKCEREVVFLLDEFGNMPPIEGLDNIITVCLGRGIRFNLVIQAFNQIKTLYGEQASTIEGNCGNQIYLLTTDEETSEKFSKLIGEQTIVSHSRSGEMYSLGKSHTENLDGRRLLKSDEVRRLKEGETVVVRGIKRSDNFGNKIVPNPIFNEGEYRMKYRYEYLYDKFDNSKAFIDVKVECLHKDIDYEKLAFSYQDEEEIKSPVEIKLEEDLINKVTEKTLLESEKKSLIDYLNRLNIIGEDEEEIILNSDTVYEIYSQVDEDIVEKIKLFFPK